MPLHIPSPQTQPPQSSGQLLQFSVPLQVPSPQRGPHDPQSLRQVLQFSVVSQAPLPHVLHAPQSRGHVTHVSPVWHILSPQRGGSHSRGPQTEPLIDAARLAKVPGVPACPASGATTAFAGSLPEDELHAVTSKKHASTSR